VSLGGSQVDSAGRRDDSGAADGTTWQADAGVLPIQQADCQRLPRL